MTRGVWGECANIQCAVGSGRRVTEREEGMFDALEAEKRKEWMRAVSCSVSPGERAESRADVWPEASPSVLSFLKQPGNPMGLQ
jgi:hypothetical protein